jgi:hypothetical protein
MAATAQQIVKWTDENGHVHYSDHAPAGHTAVNSVDLPKSAGGGSGPAAHSDTLDPQQPSPSNNGEGLASEFDAEQAAASTKRAQDQQREAQQQATLAARKKADQAVIDRCKEQHNLNCKDAKGIREREHLQAQMQCTTPAGCRKVEEIWQQQQQALGN